jgi:hypothetical protein
VEVVHAVAPDDRVARKKFERTMLGNLDKDKEFVRQIIFSDTSVFQVSGNLKHATVHCMRDSPEVNKLHGLMSDHLIRRFTVSKQL